MVSTLRRTSGSVLDLRRLKRQLSKDIDKSNSSIDAFDTKWFWTFSQVAAFGTLKFNSPLDGKQFLCSKISSDSESLDVERYSQTRSHEWSRCHNRKNLWSIDALTFLHHILRYCFSWRPLRRRSSFWCYGLATTFANYVDRIPDNTRVMDDCCPLFFI